MIRCVNSGVKSDIRNVQPLLNTSSDPKIMEWNEEIMEDVIGNYGYLVL